MPPNWGVRDAVVQRVVHSLDSRPILSTMSFLILFVKALKSWTPPARYLLRRLAYSTRGTGRHDRQGEDSGDQGIGAEGRHHQGTGAASAETCCQAGAR